MHEFIINDITVKYPFDPYKVQKDYMQSVIQSLENGENAILESPTGTGKTLCLLCSTLGWIEHQKKLFKNENLNHSDANKADETSKKAFNNVPLVIYASRTHSQLLQAMQELKRSAYGYMKAGVVASRDQLCIHPDLKKESNANKIHKCKELRSNRACHYYNNVGPKTVRDKFSDDSVLDIEDLVRNGKEFECCPYYVAQHLAQKADIIFMPYNYLLDPKIREISQMDLRDAIVIFDEAHNVAKVCEDSACTKITSTHIFIAMRDIKYISKSMTNAANREKAEFSPEELNSLMFCLNKLKNEILKIEIISPNREDPYPGGYIFELLKNGGISEDNQEFVIGLLQRVIAYLVELAKIKTGQKGMGLQALLDFLQIAYSSSAPDLRERVNRSYKVYIQYEPSQPNDDENGYKNKKKRKRKPKADEDDTNRKIINFWCFSAEFGMNYLQRQMIRCLILTSGTLSPLDSLMNELQIPFPITLSNRHVINDWQIFAKFIEYGPDEKSLDSRYNNRGTDEYMSSLGRTILKFSKVVPDGLLVFFPSYSVMNACIQFWKTNEIYDTIDEKKKIFIEPRTKDELRKSMTDYYTKINDPNSSGAIFMAVLRGKVSEGLDFADMYGRGVIVTGIPLAPCKDPKVILKKDYLNKNRTRENKMLSGWDWYYLDAVRAVNQAIGRVIRHKDDYGAILLCDDRFEANKRNISAWIKGQLSCQPLATIVKDLGQFYERAKQSLPEPTPITMPQLDISDAEEDPADHFQNDNIQNDIFAIKAEPSDNGESESDDDTESESDDEDAEPSSPKPSTSTNGNDSVVNGSHVKIHKKKLRLSMESGTEDGQNNQNGAVKVVNEPMQINPILKIMEDEIGTDKYQQLVQTLSKYGADGNYEFYRDSLFAIFDNGRWIYSLKGCVLFTKSEHRADFDKDIEKFMRAYK